MSKYTFHLFEMIMHIKSNATRHGIVKKFSLNACMVIGFKPNSHKKSWTLSNTHSNTTIATLGQVPITSQMQLLKFTSCSWCNSSLTFIFMHHFYILKAGLKVYSQIALSKLLFTCCKTMYLKIWQVCFRLSMSHSMRLVS